MPIYISSVHVVNNPHCVPCAARHSSSDSFNKRDKIPALMGLTFYCDVDDEQDE